MTTWRSGKLTEIFGSGTAAVISPVGELKYGDDIVSVGNGGVGPVAQRLFDAIQGIQYGNAEEPMGGIEPVSEIMPIHKWAFYDETP